MLESYIQYAAGYNKEEVDKTDILKAIKDIQEIDEEHRTFWVSVITANENVIEVNKDLSLTVIFEGVENKYQAKDWKEVEQLYDLLLHTQFAEIKEKIK